MFKQYTLIILLAIPILFFAQVKTDTLISKSDDYVIVDGDTLSMLHDTIYLEDVRIYKEKLDPEAKKQFLLLQNRVYRVYPYAKVASERITALNANMDKLKSNKDKKRYFKIVEDYMENEFKAQLKKLSRKQGQILVKLIHRQTGITTFDLIKDYKSGWKAFWSNNTAKLFDINLKAKYEPNKVNEDYLIETILKRAFENNRLIEQKPATPYNYDELTEYWMQKAEELNKKK